VRERTIVEDGRASGPRTLLPSDTYVRQLIAKDLTGNYQVSFATSRTTQLSPGQHRRPRLPRIRRPPKVLAARGSLPRLLSAAFASRRATASRDAGDLNSTIGHDVALVSGQHPNGVHLTFLDVNTGGVAGPVRISSSDQNLFEPSVGGRHNLCGTGTSWMNGLVKLHLSSRSFHPSELGNQAEGRLLSQVLPHLDWSAVSSAPAPNRLTWSTPASVDPTGGGIEASIAHLAASVPLWTSRVGR